MTYLNTKLHVSASFPFQVHPQPYFSIPTRIIQMHHSHVLDFTDPNSTHSLSVNKLWCSTLPPFWQSYSAFTLFLCTHSYPLRSSQSSSNGLPLPRLFYTFLFHFFFFIYFLFLTISRFSCQPLALALFLSWYGCFSLKNSCDHTDFSATNQFSPLSHFFLF